MTKILYAQIALPTPIRALFDYLIPDGVELAVGQRVVVPFGRRQLVGIVIKLNSSTDAPVNKLKNITEILDEEAIYASSFIEFLHKVNRYYHHSLGETLFTALPSRYKKAIPLDPITHTYISLNLPSTYDPDTLLRAPKQKAIVDWLQQQLGETSLEENLKQHFKQYNSSIKSLLDKNFIRRTHETVASMPTSFSPPQSELNQQQADACNAIRDQLHHFHPFLLYGVTGSGKTEVYLHIVADILETQKQALVLVPEITLTPQFIRRFTACFGDSLVTYHSGLSDKVRAQNWLSFKEGVSRIMIGTRSAIFAPMQAPGVIIIDEEHDQSYKQQDGLKYSARDMAVMRSRFENIPVVLGSATPSFESLQNALQEKYSLLTLPHRAGNATPPKIKIVDLKHYPYEEQFSALVLDAMELHLARGEQVLVFLNRRGYSPVLICSQCGWQAICHRCDRPTTYHAHKTRLNCHHCGNENQVPRQCPSCGNINLAPVGFGTERIEKFLQQRFPHFLTSRFDRDRISRKGELEASLEKVHSNEARILLGTQMLTKGHDFPNVTMVVILDADQSLFGADLRAAERFIQLVTQVSGRAGRADKPGIVYIQTHHGEHPLIQQLLKRDYMEQAKSLLQERETTMMPPSVFSACFRAEANHEDECYAFLSEVYTILAAYHQPLELLGPAPAIMPRKAGRFRVQLLLLSENRGVLHQVIQAALPAIEKLPAGRKTRWSLEVDPQELA